MVQNYYRFLGYVYSHSDFHRLVKLGFMAVLDHLNRVLEIMDVPQNRI